MDCEKDTSQNGNGDQGKGSVSGESDTQKEASSEQTDEKDNTVELPDLHTMDSYEYEVVREAFHLSSFNKLEIANMDLINKYR